MLDLNATVPSGLVHQAFVATPLTSASVAMDYAAYMASPDVIGVHSDGRWPVLRFTVEEDRDLIAIHQADHNARRAFTFLLLDRTESESLGCVYLNPLHAYLSRVGADARTLSTFPSASAMVTFWIRQDRQETSLPDTLAAELNTWLLTEWPFHTHLFRILPAERSSRTALERLALRRVTLRLPAEHRPYLQYR